MPNKMRLFVFRLVCVAFLLVLALAPLSCGGGATLQPPPPASYTLVWSDEFSGPDGSAPDSAKWTYDLGGNGWGNNELESYTNRTQNAQLKGGNLVITAQKDTYADPKDRITRNYTSARLKAQNLFSQVYGRFEARIKIPAGQGMWPAFWMLGNDISSVGWPKCGEIDIMENIGKEPSTVHGSLHGPSTTGRTSDVTAPFTLCHIRSIAVACGWYLGLRSSVLHHLKCCRRRRLARPAGQRHRLPAANARRLRPRLHQNVEDGLQPVPLHLFLCVLRVSALKLFLLSLGHL